jgi:hypothetical protein
MTKLLIETSHEVEMLTEDTGSGKQFYIEGIFAQSEVINGNGRMYEKAVMNNAVDRYISEFVSKRRALGELNHPDRPFADPAMASILIKEMKWMPNGRDVYGKALVMNTPQGQIVKGLMESGFNMGVSTRGLGTVKESRGIKYVQKDFFMTAVDCVDLPSGPDCYVNQLRESTWAQSNGVWVPINESGEQVNEDMFMTQFEKWMKSVSKNV